MTIELSGNLLSKIDRATPLYQKLVTANEKLALKDPNIWGEKAKTEAAIRLNWVDLPITSFELINVLKTLIAKFSGKDRLVLCGMGGSSLAPEVLAATYRRSEEHTSELQSH